MLKGKTKIVVTYKDKSFTTLTWSDYKDKIKVSKMVYDKKGYYSPAYSNDYITTIRELEDDIKYRLDKVEVY